MPCCHFLLIVIVLAIMLIYNESFKNMKMSKMLSITSFNKKLVKPLEQPSLILHKDPQGNSTVIHLMCAVTHTQASTLPTCLMNVKNSMCHFCLWHLLSGTLECRKWKKDQKYQIE